MHLAVKSSERLENSRPVRSLLYNGAPITIKDKEGKLPIDLAYELEDEKIKKEVIGHLTQKMTLKHHL